jgi:outer membrane lipase/esterase
LEHRVYVEKLMKFNGKWSFLRQVCTAAMACAALAGSLLVAGCGVGSTFDPLKPTRIVVMGDGLVDMGQVGGTRYTVNDGSVNTWVEQATVGYGLTVTAQVTGGQGWARGNARIALKPDAAGLMATLTLTEQVDAFLASSTIGSGDIIVLSAGISDLLVQSQLYQAGTITADQMNANLVVAAQALASQSLRLTTAGAKHVLVSGVYNLGKSPYAAALGQAAVLETASVKFNEALLVAMFNNGQGIKTLYFDIARQSNLMTNSLTMGNYGFTNATAAACTVSADQCTTSTIGTGITYAAYAFADDRYFTPVAQRSLGDTALAFMKQNW